MFIYIKSEEEFNYEIKKSKDQLVLIDYYADWCMPCKQMDKVLQQIQNEFGIRIVKVDVDNDKLESVVNLHRVQALPTFVLYKNMKNVQRLTGANPQGLRQMIYSSQ